MIDPYLCCIPCHHLPMPHWMKVMMNLKLLPSKVLRRACPDLISRFSMSMIALSRSRNSDNSSFINLTMKKKIFHLH